MIDLRNIRSNIERMEETSFRKNFFTLPLTKEPSKLLSFEESCLDIRISKIYQSTPSQSFLSPKDFIFKKKKPIKLRFNKDFTE